MSEAGLIVVESSAVVWKINNFKEKCSKNGELITSPKFQSGDYQKNIFWYLELYPFGDGTESEGYLSLFLRFLPTSTIKDHICSYEFSLLNGTQIDASTKKVSVNEKFISGGNSSWGYNKLIKRSDLLKKDSTLLKDNTLIISCSISSTPKTTNSLTSEYKSLFDSGTFSDVTIVVDNKEIKAHKAILSARSKVFSAMLKHNMAEGNTNIIKIPDVEFSVMEKFLIFLYSGKIDGIEECVKSLIAVANKYDVNDLKLLCENSLLNSLTIDNACEFVLIANLYNCSKLESQIVDYMLGNMKKIIKTKGFDDLSSTNQSLFKKIFCKLVETKL